jgi:predicted nucleic acid-binding protein
LKGDQRIFPQFMLHYGSLNVSVVSVAELTTWAKRKSAPINRVKAVDDLLSAVAILSVDERVARLCGDVRAQLLDLGKPTATTDLLIAATALVHDLTVVTHNVKDFLGVPKLRVVDWLQP